MSAVPLQVKALFLEIIERTSSPQEQDELLKKLCAGNTELKAEVTLLLQSSRQLGDFLENSIYLGGNQVTQAADTIGTKLGPYEIVGKLGEGGMGTVFVAQQISPIRRKVALKLFKAGLESRNGLARFESEQQALAMLDHPQIAKVYSAGVSDLGQPYFAMELIQGTSLTEYCTSHRLTLRDRVALFVQVCLAVQYAHRNGIIHRDLKPSNILVTEEGGRPVPKIIDFGVAKAVGHSLTQRTLETFAGSLIGTLDYMSPEQSAGARSGIDTRSDVYSLGILLYELLTDTTPLYLHREQRSLQELLSVIQEEDIEPPSVRAKRHFDELSKSNRSDILRQQLVKMIQGDLDWITLKALEKDRNRRYDSAGLLADDLQRYLDDRPVSASPPSASYRIWKLIRRNRGVFTSATLILLTLIAGLAVSVAQAVRASKAEILAKTRLDEVNQARMSELQQLESVRLERANADRLRELADKSQRRSRQAVDAYFTAISENRLLEVPGLQPLRRKLLEAALEFYGQFSEQELTDPADRYEQVAAQIRVSNVYYQNNEIENSLAYLDQALDRLEQLQAMPERLKLEQHLAGYIRHGRLVQYFAYDPKDLVQAARILERAALRWQQFSVDHPTMRGFQSDLAELNHRMIDVYQVADKSDQLERVVRQSAGLWQSLLQADPSNPDYVAGLAEARFRMAGSFNRNGQPAEALVESRIAVDLLRELTAKFPDIPGYRADLANGLRRLGSQVARTDSTAAGEPIMAQSLSMWDKLVSEFPQFSGYRKQLANVCEQYGRFLKSMKRDNSLQYLIRGQRLQVELAEETGDHSDAIRVDNYDGAVESSFRLMYDLHAIGKMQEAEEMCQQAIRFYQTRTAIQYSRFRAYHTNRWLGGWYRVTGRYDAGIAAFKVAEQIADEDYCADPGNVKKGQTLAIDIRQVADTQVANQQLELALANYARANSLFDKVLSEGLTEPTNLIEWDYCYSCPMRVYLSQGDLANAESLARRESLHCERWATDYPQKIDYRDRLTRIRFDLSEILRLTGRNVEAQTLRDQVLTTKPISALSWRALGAARYRAEQFAGVAEAMNKSLELAPYDEAPIVAAYLAMSYERLGMRTEAREWYDKSSDWQRHEIPRSLETTRIHDEACEVLGISGTISQPTGH